MKIPVRDIQIRSRIRKNLGDLTSLMESMRRHGLLSPIVVNGNRELIAGHRRLESAKKLGWTSIDVIVVDAENDVEQLVLEIDENIHRRDLSQDELGDAYEKLDKLKNPGFLQRLWRRVRAFFARLFRGLKKRG